MGRKRISQTYTIHPDAIPGLHALATRYLPLWGGKPHVSRLIEMIGSGQFEITHKSEVTQQPPSKTAMKEASVEQIEQTIKQLQLLLEMVKQI